MSSERSFIKGDFVIYPTHGLGKVMGLETEKVFGEEQPMVVIEFDKEKLLVRVPVARTKDRGLRKLSSNKVMETALDTLRGKSRSKKQMWSKRATEYNLKINSGDPVAIAEVVRDLHRSIGQGEQSYSERQVYQAALERLAREIAAIESIDENDAIIKVEKVLAAA